MAAFVLGIFIGGIVGSCVMAVLAAGADADYVALEEVNLRVEAAADKAFRDGKLVQSLAQHEKDSARATKAAQTRKARQAAADLARETDWVQGIVTTPGEDLA
jgi:hypothetical protein